MATPMDLLRYLRTALAAVPGVQTCRIGLEATITPDDYPIVRIVPSELAVPDFARNMPAMSVREVVCLIYFGRPLHEFDGNQDGSEAGIEGLYDELFTMERALIDALPKVGPYSARYIETITDEDRGEAFKMMALRVSVTGQA
jgi:hypothetical protein